MQDRLQGFLSAHTGRSCPDLCPEITLQLAADLDGSWASLAAFDLPHSTPPFWCVAWPGGQALARFILDHPHHFQGSRVLDVGSGSGLCAIAAAKVGARAVVASDSDPIARDVIGRNASANGVTVTVSADVLGDEASGWDVILAGDVWYERFMSQRFTGALLARARRGVRVLLGDCGRAHFPRALVDEVCRYRLRAAVHERSEMLNASVWSFRRR